MPAEKDANVIILAAGIIAARQSGDVKSIEAALSDARHILFPRLTSPDYKAWQVSHGLTPTTQEEDQARAAEREKRRHTIRSKLAGHSQR